MVGTSQFPKATILSSKSLDFLLNSSTDPWIWLSRPTTNDIWVWRSDIWDCNSVPCVALSNFKLLASTWARATSEWARAFFNRPISPNKFVSRFWACDRSSMIVFIACFSVSLIMIVASLLNCAFAASLWTTASTACCAIKSAWALDCMTSTAACLTTSGFAEGATYTACWYTWLSGRVELCAPCRCSVLVFPACGLSRGFAKASLVLIAEPVLVFDCFLTFPLDLTLEERELIPPSIIPGPAGTWSDEDVNWNDVELLESIHSMCSFSFIQFSRDSKNQDLLPLPLPLPFPEGWYSAGSTGSW